MNVLGALKSTPTPNGNRFEQNETTGIELNHTSNWGHVLDNIRVKGYEVGERRTKSDGPVHRRTNVQFINCDTDVVEWEADEIRQHRR